MSDIILDYNPFYKPICNGCKFWIKDFKCKAFDKIPKDITLGKNNHSKVLEGQKGEFIFTPKK